MLLLLATLAALLVLLYFRATSEVALCELVEAVVSMCDVICGLPGLTSPNSCAGLLEDVQVWSTAVLCRARGSAVAGDGVGALCVIWAIGCCCLGRWGLQAAANTQLCLEHSRH